jgi:undecaprenyl diphosphate synthase
MDGNGRWAASRNLLRSAGHQEGLKTAKRIVKKARTMGIRYLSLYTFSTENWKRAEDEVNFLMGLIKKNLKKEYEFYRENQIRVVHSGDIERLPKGIQKEILSVMEDTKEYDGLIVNLALNYGGRDEIIRAVRQIIDERRDTMNAAVTEECIRKHLDLPYFPDPDIIIRTGGEIRISNFLLWESAYSELVFSSKLWPDFTEEDLEAAVFEYARRERKFGGVK